MPFNDWRLVPGFAEPDPRDYDDFDDDRPSPDEYREDPVETVVPAIERQRARVHAETIRQALSDHAYPHGEGAVGCTYCQGATAAISLLITDFERVLDALEATCPPKVGYAPALPVPPSDPDDVPF